MRLGTQWNCARGVLDDYAASFRPIKQKELSHRSYDTHCELSCHVATCYKRAHQKEWFNQFKLNWRVGHNLALDEWVESFIVQPMKNYSTGKF